MSLNEENKADSPEEQDSPAESTESTESNESSAARPPSLAWMNDTLEWGVRVEPGMHGMTMSGLNVGSYAEIPEFSTDMSRRPRGASPVHGVPRTDFYALSSKVDIWVDNAADLYEEAIQRRWMAHADVPWDQLTVLPGEMELAMR